MKEVQKVIDFFVNNVDYKKEFLSSFLIALIDIPVLFTPIKQNKFVEYDLWRYFESYLKIRFDISSEIFTQIKKDIITIIKNKFNIDLVKLNNIENSSIFYDKRHEITSYIYEKYKVNVDTLILKTVSEFDDKFKKIIYIYICNFPSKNEFSLYMKQPYNFDENFMYFKQFSEKFKTLFDTYVSLREINLCLVKSGIYIENNNLIYEFEFITKKFLERILSEILNPYISKYLFEKTNKIKNLLEFKLKSGRWPTEIESIKELNFIIGELEQYINLINNLPDIQIIENPSLKEMATNVLKKIERPTLYSLMNELNFDFYNALSVGKYLIEKALIKKFPIIPDTIVEDIKIFISYAKNDSKRLRIPEFGNYLEEKFRKVKTMYFEKSKITGEDILDYMERGVKWCNIFIWFHSKDSEKSTAVLDEYKIAKYLGKKIISITDDYNSLPLSARVTWALIYDSDIKKLAIKIYSDINDSDFYNFKNY